MYLFVFYRKDFLMKNSLLGKSEYILSIKYLNELKENGLITDMQYKQIDELNRKSFLDK